MVLALDPRNIGVAKDLIQRQMDEMAGLLEKDHQSEVYGYNVSLFPLTKGVTL